ncbi:MAG TPA: SusC/RagA family TonB-linked outer membrane protein [Chitinophagaceae bacterium]|nr:SusC/RagA family TonB-linked outer membrane protein [Chitinophagaceae bacterium]
MGSAFLQLQPVTGLRIKGSVSGQQLNIAGRGWRSFDNWWFGENPQNPFNGTVDPVAGTRPDMINFGNSNTVNLQKAVNVDYLKSFGLHNVNITLDASQQNYKWTGNGAERSILTNDPTLRYFSVSGKERAYYEMRGAYALIGYLGRISYNYNNRYYFDGVVRRDGSSRFAPGRQWATFPAASVAWRLSAEPFMQGLSFLNDLKLRAGYGLLGNEQTTPGWKYLSIAGVVPPSYNLGTGGQFNNRGIAFTTFPNEPLTWEKVYSGNIGFDAMLFNNSLSLTVEYYNRRTKGIIQSVELTPSTGFAGRADLNIAEVLNRGFEFQAGYNKNFGEVNFSVNANFSTVHNEVLSLLGNTALRGAGLEVGYPIGFIHGYKMGGIFQTQGEIDKWNQSQRDVLSRQQRPGDIYFQNLYGAPRPGSTDRNLKIDSLVNENDQTYLGKTIPGYFYGFTTSAAWKGFDLSVFFQGRGDVQRYNGVRAAGEGMNGFGRNLFTSVLNAWTENNKSNTMPRAVYGDPNSNLRFSDRFVENAGYLRLQNLQIGYNFPKKLIDRTAGAVQNLRLYVSGINLFTLTDYTGLDPENDLFPSTRQFLVGVKAGF